MAGVARRNQVLRSETFGGYPAGMAQKEKLKLYRQKLRKLFIDFYGGSCTCCGETEPKFLAIDHVHGGGRQERLRSSTKNSWELIRAILLGKKPKENYTVLCHNCNLAKGFYGRCPHQEG